MSQRYQALRGTRDILPDEVARWQALECTTRRVFARYGFREIRTPIIEATELFSRSVGSATDIVSKEMYTFQAGDESICLRPECTASVVRAFVEHSLHRNVGTAYPERYFYIGPMFRHERPQKGRSRQFHQIGVEVLGAAEPLADAETLQMLDAFLEDLGLEDRSLVLNSVGDDACRPLFRTQLKSWLASRLDRLCADCHRRYEQNPLRVFDCKVEADRQLLCEAPKPLDTLCAPCRDHFTAVCRALEAYGVSYDVDARMVRGLDYYQRTVFEVVSSRLGAQNAVLGGGRYDGLVEALGGPAIPGFGFAIGMERLVLTLQAERDPDPEIDIAVVVLGPEVFEATILLTQRLRKAGLRCLMPLAPRPMGAQLRRADKLGARFALFVGQDELTRGTYGLKSLATGEQVPLDEPGIVARLKGST